VIVVLKPEIGPQGLDELRTALEGLGVATRASEGGHPRLLEVVSPAGDAAHRDRIRELPGVEGVVLEALKQIQRDGFEPVDFGTSLVPVMAGPCSVESWPQLLDSARCARDSGALLLRGGAYKPRSSPYSFQGLGEEGLELLSRARDETGLLVVTEALDQAGLDLVAEHADMVQIGTRNMSNFPLLRKAGRCGKPVLLKRGFSSTLEEWLLAAEYVLSEGNEQVVLRPEPQHGPRGLRHPARTRGGRRRRRRPDDRGAPEPRRGSLRRSAGTRARGARPPAGATRPVGGNPGPHRPRVAEPPGRRSMSSPDRQITAPLTPIEDESEPTT